MILSHFNEYDLYIQNYPFYSRHVFHPFCLGVMIKSSNKCLVCKEDLHPNWWSSWGFGEQNHRLAKLAQDLDMEEGRKRTIASIRDAAKVGLDAILGNPKNFVSTSFCPSQNLSSLHSYRFIMLRLS